LRGNNGYNIEKEVLIMKNFNILSIFAVLLMTLFSFNSFAMENKYNGDIERQTPQNEKTYEDESLNYEWTWLSDDLCVRFRKLPDTSRTYLEDRWGRGMISPAWAEKRNGIYQRKIRDTYSGKWSQSADSAWSFEFDDKTIPVGVTKINGVLYAFTGYGELKEGYEYYPGIKTAADGLVTANSAEFIQWLATQYLPECTSHE
jgi:hypothetical protein